MKVRNRTASQELKQLQEYRNRFVVTASRHIDKNEFVILI
jgi:hypothetical protein